MKKTILLALALVFATTAIADAQPRRPAWPDVCCGGPCCAKPQRP